MDGMEQFFLIVGIIYTFKILLNILLHIKDGVTAYVLPKISAPINFTEKYGKWAVVTGCTQGIGRYYAEELAKRGMSIVLISRSKPKLDDVANDLSNKYGVSTKIIVADFTNTEILPMILSRIDEFQIDVGVLVNNVGLLGGHHMPFLELDQDTVTNMITINVLAGTILCHAMLPKMKEKGKGAMINISSSASYFTDGMPYLAVYAATKHYMTAFTQAISAEYSDSGVTIQCVEPGQVSTKMTEYFEKTGTILEPQPDTYAKQACQTLGFRAKTTGYWPHSLMLITFKLIFGLLGDSLTIRSVKNIGKQNYEQALIKIQKAR